MVKKDQKIPVHVSLPLSVVDEIDGMVENKEFTSRSNAIEFFVRIGRIANFYKKKCSDPEFVKEMKEKWNEHEIMNWAESLPEQDRSALR